MDEAACGRELLSSFLAAQLGIHVPMPVVVHVNDNFISQMASHSDFGNINKCKGMNFGSTYMEGSINMLPSQRFTPTQEAQAARIFLFDMTMQNSDRRREKPNMFIYKENIYVIDHELPLGFLVALPFLSVGPPWELNELDITTGKNHFFYPLLFKNTRVAWDSVGEPFLDIKEDFWESAWNWMPDGWMSEPDFLKTKNHFTSVLSNFETFKSEIWNKILMA
jgi:hypothetical protein